MNPSMTTGRTWTRARALAGARACAAACAALVAAGCARSGSQAPEPRTRAAADTTAMNRVTLNVVPPGADTALAHPPTLAPPKPLTLPRIVERTLDNGMKLMVVEQHELPLVDFVLLVRTGGEANTPRLAGLAGLTADMLDEGTTSRDALQVADQAAFLGVQLGAGSAFDQSSVTLHTPTAQLDSALALFADVALHPAFRGADLERVRKERLTDLIQLKDRSPEIANRAYASIVFGQSHPYGLPLTGTEASIRSIARADVMRFYTTYFRPNNATLIVVGDVTPDDVQRRAERLFGGWRAGPVPPITLGAARRSGATTIYLIDKPGAPQSSFRVGGVGVPRSTKDYFSILVMNTILGGAFTSRLNQNLREKHGYTYGAFSGFSMRRQAGPFTARAEVVAEKTDSALVQFLAELNAIRDTVPAAELEKAKRYVELQLPGDFETTTSIAAQLIPVVLYDLPRDYYNTYVQQVERVTQADVQRVAREYISPGNLAVVIVGDRKAIEPGLRALKAGEVNLRDLSGQPVPVRDARRAAAGTPSPR